MLPVRWAPSDDEDPGAHELRGVGRAHIRVLRQRREPGELGAVEGAADDLATQLQGPPPPSVIYSGMTGADGVLARRNRWKQGRAWAEVVDRAGAGGNGIRFVKVVILDHRRPSVLPQARRSASA